jgi:hypothetical protein
VEETAEKVDDVVFEEKTQYFGCLQERIKAYWTIPFSKIFLEERKDMKVNNIHAQLNLLVHLGILPP